MVERKYDQIWCWICQSPVNATRCSRITHFDIEDACFVDAISTLLHLVFAVVFLAAILILICRSKCCNQFQYSKYLIRLPGHSCRYFVTVMGVLILITCVGEGVLTDRLNSGTHETKPHFYLPFFLATFTLLLSLLYYHHIESFKLSQTFLMLIVLYWILAITSEILRLLNLLSLERISIDVLRFDLNCACLMIYGTLLIVELCRLISKVTCFV